MVVQLNTTLQNMKRPLQWCEAHRHLTMACGKMFFGLMNLADGRIWVWWMPSERFLSDCIVPTVQIGRGSTMV